jgi:hypothetical protein
MELYERKKQDQLQIYMQRFQNKILTN